MSPSQTLQIAGKEIAFGTRQKIDIRVAKLYDFTGMNIPVEVVCGKEAGAVFFVCAAIHGDEINGVEIIKRLLTHPALKKIKGTLIAVPIVNVFGFNTKSRYLPDRRDLNRCFPGIADGSLASQLAHTFMQEIVTKSLYGIDLHTGAVHRSNLPQLRGDMEDPETRRLAEAFRVPVIINSSARDGSLREAAREKGIKILLYEGGEALRFNEEVIETGVEGVLAVMRSIGMLPTPRQKTTSPKESPPCFVARSSHWMRAPHSGTLIAHKKLGDNVVVGDLLGVVSDPFGRHRFELHSGYSGIVIGQTMLPLVNEGDACFHIACNEVSKQAIEVTPPQELVSAQLETFVT
jgi:predicted deacylase